MIEKQTNPKKVRFDNIENIFCASQRADAILCLILESKADVLLSSCEDVFHALYSVSHEIREINQMAERMVLGDEEEVKS